MKNIRIILPHSIFSCFFLLIFRKCFCEGKHISVPSDIKLDDNGNPLVSPTWNTCCPVAAMEFMESIQGERWKPYCKFYPKTKQYGQNIGDVPTFANAWLKAQGVDGGPFDRNSGRKSLSRWLDHLHVQYDEHIHIHGDLEEVWRAYYQDKLRKSAYRVREQAPDSDVATAALTRFASWLHESGDPKPSVKDSLQALLNRMD